MYKDYFGMFHAYHCNKPVFGPHHQFDAIRKIFPKTNFEVFLLLNANHLIFALIVTQTGQAGLKFIASLIKFIHRVTNSRHILLL